MWNFLKKMRYVQFDRCELYWKSLLAANWSWQNYTEQYVRDRNLLSYSYVFGLIHIYSYSVPSSNPRAKGAVVPWCRKERLREDFGFLVVSTFFKFLFDTIITDIFLSFVDIRDVVRLHIHIHGLTFTFSFLARCTLGRLSAFHPSQDLPRKDPEGGLWESADEFDWDW